MKNFLKGVARNFFSGTLFIVPLVATGYFIFLSFTWLDSLLHLKTPGIGLLIIIVVITIFGYLTKTFAFETLEGFIDRTINRLPMVNIVYASLRDLIKAFVGEKKKFNHPVLVTMNKNSEVYQIGFITQSDLSSLSLTDLVVVYIPHSYAISGFHYLVPRNQVKPLNISGPEAMKFIISGGISGFEETKPLSRQS